MLLEAILFLYFRPKIYHYFRDGRAHPQELVVPFYPDQDNDPDPLIDMRRDEATMRSAEEIGGGAENEGQRGRRGLRC